VVVVEVGDGDATGDPDGGAVVIAEVGLAEGVAPGVVLAESPPHEARSAAPMSSESRRMGRAGIVGRRV